MSISSGASQAFRRGPRARRGSALLAVLWLTAALAAIGFALSTTVRSETDRAAISADGSRAYYLAAGAIERATLELLWSSVNPNKRLIPLAVPVVNYEFPGGVARVEIIPETSKLNLNSAPPATLYRLCLTLGLEPERAREIATAIDEWRRPVGAPLFDAFYLTLTPSFRPPHASFQENEELLLVRGVTPDIYYGTYVPTDSAVGPRLAHRTGLVDCLSVFGSKDRVDINTASPAVLAAVGLTPFQINAVVERRRLAPILPDQLVAFLQSLGAQEAPLRSGGNSIFLVRATANTRASAGKFSDLKRTVAATVKFMPAGYDSPVHILRWYDSAWSE